MKKNYISLAALTGVAFLGLVSCNDQKEDKKDTTTNKVIPKSYNGTSSEAKASIKISNSKMLPPF